jgi:inorganic pyrophosphatase
MTLPPCFSNDRKSVHVIIETPGGSRNKLAYDEATGLFKLKKVLPAGMKFPFDMGFLPQTRAADGDPLDIMVLMDEPVYPGCLVECRPVGVIKLLQRENRKQAVRNDRLIAVPLEMRTYENIHDIRELNKNLVNEIIYFLETYNHLENIKTEILSLSGTQQAIKLIQKQLL